MNKIKFLACVFLSSIISPFVVAQKEDIIKHTIYIVRHAEKDTGSNPVLSVKGRKRAGDLYRALKNKKIELIYVSQYRRTGMTADSLRIYLSIDTIHYTADTTGELLFEKINATAGKAKIILVIGHSNTLPAIIRKAGVKNYALLEIPDYEYDNLFIIKQKKHRAVLKSEKYGAVSIPPAKASQMNISQ